MYTATTPPTGAVYVSTSLMQHTPYYLPSPMDHRDIMLLAASMAVGCLISIDNVCSLPENMRANVVEAIAIMSGLTVTISNRLG